MHDAYIQTCVCMHVYTYILVYLRMYTYICMCDAYIKHVCIHTYIRIIRKSQGAASLSARQLLHPCLCALAPPRPAVGSIVRLRQSQQHALLDGRPRQRRCRAGAGAHSGPLSPLSGGGGLASSTHEWLLQRHSHPCSTCRRAWHCSRTRPRRPRPGHLVSLGTLVMRQSPSVNVVADGGSTARRITGSLAARRMVFQRELWSCF